MDISLDPPHVDLDFMSPLSDARATHLVDFLCEQRGSTVLDIGCGRAELLMRTVEAAPGRRGIGVDVDAGAVEAGRRCATRRGLGDRLTLRVGEWPGALVREPAGDSSGNVDAVICIGASQIWGPPVEMNQPIDYTAALRALRGLVPVGGHVVYGEGIWSTEPTEAAVAPLAGRDDEFVRLGQLVDLAVGEGFMPISVGEAGQDEWDVFESGYAACYSRWLASHPHDHPQAPEVRERAAAQRAAYFGGYRGVLGLAYLCLVAV